MPRTSSRLMVEWSCLLASRSACRRTTCCWARSASLISIGRVPHWAKTACTRVYVRRTGEYFCLLFDIVAARAPCFPASELLSNKDNSCRCNKPPANGFYTPPYARKGTVVHHFRRCNRRHGHLETCRSVYARKHVSAAERAPNDEAGLSDHGSG